MVGEDYFGPDSLLRRTMDCSIKDEPLRLYDFDVCTVESIIVSILSPHGIAPDATGPYIHFENPGRDSVRPPPLRDVLGIGPDFEDKFAWRVEITRQNQFAFRRKRSSTQELIVAASRLGPRSDGYFLLRCLRSFLLSFSFKSSRY